MKGFTLVEIAIVLAILALLLGGMLVPISAQIDQQKIMETEKSIELAKEALTGFAMVKGYLPCPAVSATDGNEDRSSGNCNKRVGFLPWVTLASPRQDAWGHLFRYSVSPAFSMATPTFSFSSSADITIWTRNAAGVLARLSNDNGIAAVVLSHGKDGYGGTSISGAALVSPPAANVDETANAVNANLFVSRTQVTDPTTSGGAFDDIVDWISPFTLFDRMVAAGRLP